MSIHEVNNTQLVSQQKQTEVIQKLSGTNHDKQKSVKSSGKTKIEISIQDMSEMISRVNEVVRSIGTKIGFSYDTINDKKVILVKDKETDEVIREIPSKEMLNLVKQLERVSGIIYNNKI